MNAKKIFVVLALGLFGSVAFAADRQVGGEEYASFAIPNTFSKTNNTVKTRAEVVAELKQARGEGQLVGGEEYATIQKTVSTVSRAEVKAEAIQSAKNGSRNTEYSFGG